MERVTLIAVLLSFVAVTQVAALRCWRCSSDVSNGKFCEDPFNPNDIPDSQRKWSYVDCPLPASGIPPHLYSQARPVCKKITQLVEDKMVFARACSWELEGAASDACKYAATPPNVRTLFCETCRTNGCNGELAKEIPAERPSSTDEAKDSGATAAMVANGVMALVVGLVASMF